MLTVRGFYKNSAREMRNLLVQWGKRPSEVARILEVKDQQINNILTGKAKIPAKYLAKLSDLSGYSYVTLVDAILDDERQRIHAAAQKYSEVKNESGHS